MTTAPTWPDLLTTLVQGHDLAPEQTHWAMAEILGGNASPVHVAAFAVALRAKGETVDEIVGLAEAMTEAATPIAVSRDAVDIVGTGGDRANTVNVSTMAALVAAAAGAKVVKHGNRSASSMCGAADCLEALDVRLEVPPAQQQAVLDATGLCFLFAPLYHQSLRHAGPVRRELGIQTTFNLLGPLTNPAQPEAAAIGVADARAAALVAGVLARRGRRGLVFHGGDGLDELTTTTTSQVWLLSDGEVRETVLDPRDLGAQPATREDLAGGLPEHNARVAREVLAGATGPVRDIVLVNAAAALLAHRGPNLDTDVTEQVAGCLDEVTAAIDSGRATETLQRFAAATNAA